MNALKFVTIALCLTISAIGIGSVTERLKAKGQGYCTQQTKNGRLIIRFWHKNKNNRQYRYKNHNT